MKARDLAGLGIVGLRTRRLRSALTAIGIAIGIAAMVAVLGISASSRADVLAELDRLGTNLLEVTPGQSFLGDDSTLPEEAAAMADRAWQLCRERYDARVVASTLVRLAESAVAA